MAEAGWTVESLKDHFDQRFVDTHERLTEFKTEYGSHHDDLVAQVQQLRDLVAQSTGGSSTSQRATNTIIAVVAVAVALGTMIAFLVVGHP